ncbi:hypothetical protein HMPREF0497_1381, partial [Lentilactobacillus buchneri ATCC 11577]
ARTVPSTSMATSAPCEKPRLGPSLATASFDDELGVALHLVVDGGLHHDVVLDLPDIGGHQAFGPVRDIGFRA